MWIVGAIYSCMYVSFSPQKPANILVMGEGPERGRVKIGMYVSS